MSKARFKAELIEGHKGVTAVVVPFDPEAVWRQKPVKLDPRRDGWLVKGTLNGVRFDGYIGYRWRRYFLIIDPELREAAKVSVGDTLSLVVEPTATAKALAKAREQSKETTAPAKGRPDAVELPEPQRKPRKAPPKRISTGETDGSQTDPAVVALLRDLEHPLKQEIEAVRQLILGASPAIREGIKWNAPSFRTTDYFATFNLRTRDRVRLVLHTGAKVKDTATTGLKVADPAGLLEWLAKDRCLVTLNDGKDIRAKRAALQALLREWIRWV
jgi:hypothetical protein